MLKRDRSIAFGNLKDDSPVPKKLKLGFTDTYHKYQDPTPYWKLKEDKTTPQYKKEQEGLEAQLKWMDDLVVEKKTESVSIFTTVVDTVTSFFNW